MQKRTRSRWRKRRHAEDAAKRTMRDSGRRTDVAAARGLHISTVSHRTKGKCDPVLLAAYQVAIEFDEHAQTSVRPMAQALDELADLSEIVLLEDGPFVERGVWLIEEEHRLDSLEDAGGMHGQLEHAEALRRYGRVVRELPLYLEEAALRGLDLHAEWRARKSPGQQASRTGAVPPRGHAEKVTSRGSR